MAINYVYKLAEEFSQTVTGIKNSLKQTMNIVLVCLREIVVFLYYIYAILHCQCTALPRV